MMTSITANLLAFLDIGNIVLYCALIGGALGAICCGVAAVFVSRNRSKNAAPRAEAEQTQETQAATERDEAVLCEDFVMSRNVIYSVGAEGKLNVGKYTVENADDASTKFNMRVNGLVREYEGGDIITLADGDTVSPVSGSVIISAFKE